MTKISCSNVSFSYEISFANKKKISLPRDLPILGYVSYFLGDFEVRSRIIPTGSIPGVFLTHDNNLTTK